MACIKFFFVLFGLLIVQAHCSKIHGDDPDDGEIVIPVSVVWKILMGIINATANYGISTIDELNNALPQIEDNIHDVEENLIDVLWNSFVILLDETEKGSSNYGKAAVQCAKQEGDVLKGALLKFTFEISKDEITRPMAFIGSMLPLLKHTRGSSVSIKEYIEQLDACGKDENSNTCIDERSAVIYGAVRQLFFNVEGDLTNAAALLGWYSDYVSSKEKTAVADFVAVGEGIFKDMSECIKQKINQ